MAETTKRERSGSPEQVEHQERPESKRPKEDKPSEEAEQTSVTDEVDEPQSKTEMAAESESANASVPAEEQTAIELDNGTTEGDDHDETKPLNAAGDGEASAGGADGHNDADNVAGNDGAALGASNTAEDGADGGELQPQYISMRTLIVTGDASIIIGKQGKHINEIRDKSGAKLTISESLPGNPERIMSVAGQLDAVSKAFGLVVRRINDEPFDQASLPGSRAVTIRFIIPNSRMGSIIGKGGAKIKEIQEASGARLNAGEHMLPGSTERVLSVLGVADAVHIAVYYVGTILLEHPDRNANNITYRPTAGNAAGAATGYSGGGRGGAGSPGYGGAAGGGYGAGSPSGGPSYGPGPPQLPPGSQTQQIFIPNDLVGCIIGKGGSKINEIRQMSASHIKIMEQGAGALAGGAPNERLVTITGPPANIQVAVQLLYQRLEQEKQRLASGGGP
ncbi:unnamed protein product [Sympodiomycopsis kandeliae]